MQEVVEKIDQILSFSVSASVTRERKKEKERSLQASRAKWVLLASASSCLGSAERPHVTCIGAIKNEDALPLSIGFSAESRT